jgi:hypothetical protein
MKKTTTVLKITAIILNALFLAIGFVMLRKIPPSGSYIILALIIYAYPLTNLVLLLFNSKILTGTKGVVFTTLSVISGVLLLLLVVFAVARSGVPEPAFIRAVLVLWIIAPLFSVSAVVLLRTSVKKNTSETKTVISPHCGGDVNI